MGTTNLWGLRSSAEVIVISWSEEESWSFANWNGKFLGKAFLPTIAKGFLFNYCAYLLWFPETSENSYRFARHSLQFSSSSRVQQPCRCFGVWSEKWWVESHHPSSFPPPFFYSSSPHFSQGSFLSIPLVLAGSLIQGFKMFGDREKIETDKVNHLFEVIALSIPFNFIEIVF